MNLKKNNNLFLKSIINSNFLLLDRGGFPRVRSTQILSKNKFSSNLILDPVETFKTVKQFIRSVQFLQKQNSSLLHILVENKQHLELIETFLKDSNIKIPILVKENLPTSSTSSETVQLLLLLNFALKNKETLLKRLFDKNIFLVNKINSCLEKNNWGTYKIYNDLSDFKKIVFLLVIIHQVLNK